MSRGEGYYKITTRTGRLICHAHSEEYALDCANGGQRLVWKTNARGQWKLHAMVTVTRRPMLKWLAPMLSLGTPTVAKRS